MWVGAANPMVRWKERVLLCAPPKSGSDDWLCHGLLQTTSCVPDKPSGTWAVQAACGGSSSDRIRELGQSSGYRIYGCGFGQHPDQTPNRDPAHLLNVFVPGRATFSCPKKQTTACLTR
jgi:hypothetical protein